MNPPYLPATAGPAPLRPDHGRPHAWNIPAHPSSPYAGMLGDAAAVSELLDAALHPPTSAILEALTDLRFRYTVTHRLPGQIRFDDALPDLKIPPAPLQSILEHLVEGALRSNPSASPYCHVGLVSEDEDRVVLSIRDNGVALPECTMDELRRFVERQSVSHVPDRVYRLFLADALVQWLGGRLRIAPSVNGQGATLHLELPRRPMVDGKRPPLVGRHVF